MAPADNCNKEKGFRNFLEIWRQYVWLTEFSRATEIHLISYYINATYSSHFLIKFSLDHWWQAIHIGIDVQKYTTCFS